MKPQYHSFFVGSHLVPSRSYLKVLQFHCLNLVHQAQDADVAALAARHNSYVLYCLMLLMSATGHRPVTDPFHSIALFDLERGLLLIDDKEVFPVRGPRMVWLPEMAVNQMRKYLVHLDALSRKLGHLNHSISVDIRELACPDARQRMPLFFFLRKFGRDEYAWESVMPANLSQIQDAWPFPLNINRHVLSTSLRNRNCHAASVEAQLGHLEAGFDIFGIESVVDSASLGASIKPALQAHLESMGWEALDGLVPRQRMKIPVRKEKPTEEIRQFGPILRKQKREANWRAISCELDILLQNNFPEEIEADASDERIESMRKLVEKHFRSKGEGALIAVTLLRRKMSKLRRRGIKVKLPGRFVVERTERTPFEANSLYLSILCDKASSGFNQLLSQREGFVLERRLAEIAISAILYSGITDKKILVSLPEALMGGTRLTKGICSVDINVMLGNEGHRRIRWLPDSDSTSLIVGLHRHLTTDAERPDPERIASEMVEIVTELGLYKGTRAELDKPDKNWRFLSSLIRISRAHFRVNMPGFLRHYVEGLSAPAALPYWRWASIVTGVPHADDEPEKTVTEIQCDTLTLIPNTTLPGSNTWEAGKAFWKKLTVTMKVGTGRSSKRKNELVQAIQKCCQDNAALMSGTSRLLSFWLLHLCQNGTPSLPNLRAGSVVTYGRTIGPSLFEHASHLDLLGVGDIEFEDLYFRIVEESARKYKPYIVGRLREFHLFLQDAYGVPPIDWSEVAGDEEMPSVDAGLVTFGEYIKALRYLLNDETYDERSRLAHAMVLFLGFRFGLRGGEIHRLRVSDLLHNERHMFVLVRNTPYGETKTDKGVRQIPLVGSLSDIEQDFVKRWFAHAKDDIDDNNAFLISAAGNPRKPFASMTRPVEALRLATLNPKMRLRSLRHSYASRLFLSMQPKAEEGLVGELHRHLWGEVAPEEVREKLLGRKEPSPRCLYALAMVMGHGDIATTLAHYIHVLDVIHRDWLASLQAKLSDKALAYAYGVSYDNLRQLKGRKGDELGKHMLTQLQGYVKQFAPPHIVEIPANLDVFGSNAQKLSGYDLDFSNTDRLLSLFGVRTSFEGLSDRFLLSEEAVENVLESASTVQLETGFTDFALPVRSDEFWVPPTVERNPALDKEAIRSRRQLDKWYASDASRAACLKLAEIWERNYQSNTRALLFNGYGAFAEFLVSASSLGIEKENFVLTLPAEAGDIYKGIEGELAGQGYAVKVNRVPKLKSNFSPESRIKLTLRSGYGDVGYNKTLHRLLFVIQVWSDYVSRGDSKQQIGTTKVLKK